MLQRIFGGHQTYVRRRSRADFTTIVDAEKGIGSVVSPRNENVKVPPSAEQLTVCTSSAWLVVQGSSPLGHGTEAFNKLVTIQMSNVSSSTYFWRSCSLNTVRSSHGRAGLCRNSSLEPCRHPMLLMRWDPIRRRSQRWCTMR